MRKDAIIKRREVQRVLTERNIMLKLKDHPFLAKLRYAFQTEVPCRVINRLRARLPPPWLVSELTAWVEQEHIHFVMDYYGGGELFWHLHRSPLHSHS